MQWSFRSQLEPVVCQHSDYSTDPTRQPRKFIFVDGWWRMIGRNRLIRHGPKETRARTQCNGFLQPATTQVRSTWWKKFGTARSLSTPSTSTPPEPTATSSPIINIAPPMAQPTMAMPTVKAYRTDQGHAADWIQPALARRYTLGKYSPGIKLLIWSSDPVDCMSLGLDLIWSTSIHLDHPRLIDTKGLSQSILIPVRDLRYYRSTLSQYS